MESYKRLLLANRAWARDMHERKPGFFAELSQDQKPEFLWIGCSDSRVPAEEITGMQPGELFVHRNIANLVVPSDINLLSVIQYAVENLKVRHIIVCGHYGCGGVRAALSQESYGLLNKWLYYIKDAYFHHQSKLDATPVEERVDRMVEINVRQQILNLARMSVIQRAWKNNQSPQLHAWVFGLKDGLIREVDRIDANSPQENIFQFKGMLDK